MLGSYHTKSKYRSFQLAFALRWSVPVKVLVLLRILLLLAGIVSTLRIVVLSTATFSMVYVPLLQTTIVRSPVVRLVVVVIAQKTTRFVVLLSYNLVLHKQDVLVRQLAIQLKVVLLDTSKICSATGMVLPEE
jgi:hypothetical protein